MFLNTLLSALFSPLIRQRQVRPLLSGQLYITGDASLILQCNPWNNWDATQDYMVTTLAAIIGSMGGSWLAFDGVLAEIFGMVSQFKLFDLPLWEI